MLYLDMLKKYIILFAFILITPIAYANHDIVGDRCAALNDGTSPCHYGNSANGYECKKICNWRTAERPTSGGGFSGFFGAIVTAAKNLITPASAPAYIPTQQARPTTIIPLYIPPTATNPATVPCISEKSSNNNIGGWALKAQCDACKADPNCNPATRC